MAGKGALSAKDAIGMFKKRLEILPMEDAIFVGRLDAAGFFITNQRDMMSKEKTNADKATYFLDKVVGIDADHYVPMLLTEMVELKGPYARFATDIQRNMSGASGGSSGGVSGTSSDSGFNPPQMTTPIIGKQPSSQSIDLLHYAIFTCIAIGYNVKYQWTIGSGSFPSKVTGINTNTLVIPDVRSSDDNTYTCTNSNDGGSVTSNPAKLTVTGLPEVTVYPSSQSVEVTQPVKFTTTVTGVGKENFSYQWRHNGGDINEKTSNTLTIDSVTKDDGGTYECVVKNMYGDNATSNTSEITLIQGSRQFRKTKEKLSEADSADFDRKIEKYAEDNDPLGAFSCLFNNLGELFQQENFSKIKRTCLLRGVGFSPDFREKMKAATNTEEVLDVLDDYHFYCNWLNIRYLKMIVRNAGMSKAEQLIDRFERSFYSKKVSEVKYCINSKLFDPTYAHVIKLKINTNCNNLTVENLITYCRELENMGLPEGSVIPTDPGRSGCLLLACAIPWHCCLHVYEMIKLNSFKLRKLHIQFVLVESYPKIYSFPFHDTKRSLPMITGKVTHPHQIISHYYTYLEGHFDADSVSHMMHCKYLITNDDYDLITSAPNDMKMNCLILQYVKMMGLSKLFEFCNILKDIETQNFIGETLEAILKADFQSISSGATPVQDVTRSVSRSAMLMGTHAWNTTSVHSRVYSLFLNMLDQLILLMSSADVLKLDITEKCRGLMACKDPCISLFTDHYINKLIRYKNSDYLSFLLLPFITWFDHSLLKHLVLAANSKEATKLLNQFDSLVDANQPITVPSPSQLMIPLDNSDYTLVATKCDAHLQEMNIKQFSDFKKSLLTHWGITEHAIQLVAIHADHNVLYWMIPESIAPLIESHIDQRQVELKQSGIMRSAVFSKQIMMEGHKNDMLNHGLFCYLNAVDSKEDALLYRRLVDIDHVAAIKQLHTNDQIELSQKYDKLKIEFNQLQEEFSKLQSRESMGKQTLNATTLDFIKVASKYQALKSDYKAKVQSVSQQYNELNIQYHQLCEEFSDLPSYESIVKQRSDFNKLAVKYQALKSDHEAKKKILSHQDTDEDELPLKQPYPTGSAKASSPLLTVRTPPSKLEQDLEISLKNKLKKSVEGCDTQGSPTVEHSEQLNEKNVLKYMIESAMSYLQRSLSIMIKSAMSRLYGTKETLQKLCELSSQLQQSSHSSRELVLEAIDKIVKSSCKFWYRDCSVTEDWLWHCRQMLPRRGNPQEEWNQLSEDLKTWKLDICFKLIMRATHGGVYLFSSEHLCFKSNESYDFRTLAQNANKVQKFYAHASYEDIIKRFSQDFYIIEEFVIKVLYWVEREDCNPHNVSCCRSDVQYVQMKQKAYINEHTATWKNVLDGLKNLNINDLGYILVSTPCTSNIGITISKEELAQLSNIPWATIVDYDAESREKGLLNSLCEPEGDHYRFKVSCQFSSKNVVIPFTYLDIKDSKRGELCQDGHIPWIFPHGECLDESDKACPLNNNDQYCLYVRNPLINALREIINCLTKNGTQGVVSVVLCYGSYTCKNEKLPYVNFLLDLKYLCRGLLDAGGHVIVLSDSIYIVEYLKPISVLLFPLDAFCKMIQSELSLGQNELPPISMPSCGGLKQLHFIEEYFELIHDHIAEHELHQHRVQKIIKFQQRDETIPDSIVCSNIKHELRETFYKGQKVTWTSLNAGHAITRTEENVIMQSIRQMLQDRVSEKTEPAKYVIYHSEGAGATTLARKILWHLRTEFPCVILKPNYMHSEETIKCTSQDLKTLYEELQRPVLMLIDEEPSFKTIPCLTSCVLDNGTPIVFLHVQRFNPSEETPAEKELKGSSDHYILPNVLHQDDSNNLKHMFLVAFGKDKVCDGDCRIAKMESSTFKPTEGDQVTDFVQNGTLNKVVKHIKYRLTSYYLVEVTWQNGQEERCQIGTSVYSNEYRMVYLRKEIKTDRLYQTFQFYGIMYLDEEYRESMHEHIKKSLDTMCHINRANDVFKSKLLILAYLSVLFNFKVCESIHIKAFEHLCYAVTLSKAKVFQLEDFIPKGALEFIIITQDGQFRIIHPIVAHEIIKFCSSKLSFSFHFPPSFVCEFLDYMLPDVEYCNEEAALAVKRLLFYRQSNDEDGFLITKPFSELILTLDHQSPEHAVKVLDHASNLINSYHSYLHYARYMSKRLKDYDRALGIVKEADKLTSSSFEESLVLNIKGDIYCERLQDFLKAAGKLDWESDGNEAFYCHFSSCQAYRDSYKVTDGEIPLFNELTVRLILLEAIKKSKTKQQEFLKFLHCITDTEVSGSIDTCLQLVKELNELTGSTESKMDLDKSNDKAHLKLLEIRLLNIIGSSNIELKKILHDLMTTYTRSTHVNLPYITRSYIHLCQLDSILSPTDLDICLNALESNFEMMGYNDRDMMNWILITKNIPTIGGNIKKVEEKLVLWKDQGAHLIMDKRKIQSTNNPIWVNFFLTICYFIQLVEADSMDIPLINGKLTNACRAMRDKSKEKRSQFKIREWLQNAGTGFMRLKPGHPIPNEMMNFCGSVVIPSVHETQQRKGEKGFPYISWKGLCIYFDAKRQHFKQGQKVIFGVGFRFRGPQAIVLTTSESTSSKPTIARKITSENDGQKTIKTLSTGQQAQTYSQITKGSKKTTE